MPVRLTTVDGASHWLLVRDGEDEARAIRALIDRVTFPSKNGWALTTSGAYVNLDQVVSIAAVTEPIAAGFG